MIDWGYIMLIATLLIALIFSLLFILLPIVVFKKLEQSYPKKSIMSYFFLVGLAFMFLEIMFIQRFILFLGYPVLCNSLCSYNFTFICWDWFKHLKKNRNIFKKKLKVLFMLLISQLFAYLLC